MGRRWGKTVLGGDVALATASQGAPVAWVVPIYKNGRALWRWVEATVSPAKRARLCSVNKTERTVEFINGGFLGVYSADSEDSIRSEKFQLVIVDEAARIPESAWTDAIYPTLADYDGDAILISTPKRKNWFYHEYLKGLGGDPSHASFNAPSSANPNPNIQRAARLARERVPDDAYRQEWLAEFLDNGGEVFRRVRECATAIMPEQPYEGDFVMGLDWGKQNDFTWITVMDRQTRQVVDMDRFNQVGWALQRQRVIAMNERWKPSAIWAESNSIGGPNIEALWAEGLNVWPFETTSLTKEPLIQSLVLGFERREIGIPALDGEEIGQRQRTLAAILIRELEAYEQKVNAITGRSTYSAPEGMHDDGVVSLALAHHGIVNYRWHGGIHV